MEEDLKTFLRSRYVPEEDIKQMKVDKIDRWVICIMTDEERAKYIPSYGDRLAVVTFCRQREANFNKEGVLNRVRQKIEARRTKRKTPPGERQQTSVESSGLMARHKNTNAVKSNRRIEVGWLHFQKKKKQHCFRD
ncbi:hypothetical protein ATANTOWER_020816 [Ataeniobius toweri]|uniref:Uncharacterized protein n=1 Tax=Ataeniobius toweri TaxID=208326 RepID=A0ABU7CBZ3_9TELE|nr:hypothetical protein [Ataeniobius toweri]